MNGTAHLIRNGKVGVEFIKKLRSDYQSVLFILTRNRIIHYFYGVTGVECLDFSKLLEQSSLVVIGSKNVFGLVRYGQETQWKPVVRQ